MVFAEIKLGNCDTTKGAATIRSGLVTLERPKEEGRLLPAGLRIRAGGARLALATNGVKTEVRIANLLLIGPPSHADARRIPTFSPRSQYRLAPQFGRRTTLFRCPVRLESTLCGKSPESLGPFGQMTVCLPISKCAPRRKASLFGVKPWSGDPNQPTFRQYA